MTKLSKAVYKDINTTIAELSNLNFLRDAKGIAQYTAPGNVFELTFDGKNDFNNIMYDTRASCEHLMNTLLKYKQYSVLLYDKSIIQADFRFRGDTIIKERLIFIKKHNKIWSPNEIQQLDDEDEDWFSENFGIPILIRIDYDPENHEDGIHPASHFTFANHDSCRIPMKEALTFSEFVRFILLHFYNVELNKTEFRLNGSESISEREKRMIHMNWT